MNCRPWNWLWGLLPLALVALFLNMVERGRVEDDLTLRAKAALSAAGLKCATPSFEGRDGIVSGKCFDGNEQKQAIAVVLGVNGVRVVADQTKLSDLMKPYKFAAVRSGNTIRLIGFVPSEKQRAAIIALVGASIPGAKIDDKLVLARGVPDGDNWLQGIKFGFGQLGRLREGEIRLDDLKLSVKGLAPDGPSYKTVTKALGALPGGISLGVAQVDLPQAQTYSLTARFDAGRLVLQGFVPNDKVEAMLVQAAQNRFKGVKIDDQLQLAAGAPPNWDVAVKAAIEQLLTLDQGVAKLSGTQIELTGSAKDKATADLAQAALKKALPKQFAAIPNVSFPQAVVIKPLVLKPVVEKPAVALIDPYVWSAVAGGGQVVIEGYVPDEATRAEVLALAVTRFPTSKIVDREVVGVGGFRPDTWMAATGYALERIARLNSGKALLENNRLTVVGEAADEKTQKSVMADLNVMPLGFTLKAATVTFKAPPTPAVVLKPTPPAYGWQVLIDPQTITFSGNVPNEDVRKAILAYADERFKGLKVVDKMTIRANAPGSDLGWLTAMRAGLRSIALVGTGRIDLTPDQLRVLGETNVPGLADKVGRVLGASLPAGIKGVPSIFYRGLSDIELRTEAQKRADEDAARLADLERKRKAVADAQAKADADARAKMTAAEKAKADETLRLKLIADAKAKADVIAKTKAADDARSYVFSAKYDGRSVTLLGAVPSDTVRLAIIAAITKELPGRDIVDRITLRPDAPPRWDAAAFQGLRLLVQLDNGQLTLRDRLVFLSGSTDAQRTLAKVRGGIDDGLPDGFKGTEIVAFIVPPPPDIKAKDFSKFNVPTLFRSKAALSRNECEAVLDVVTGQVKALFRPASAVLDKAGQTALKSLVQVIKRCPSNRIVVAGHTDGDGATGYNQKLSEDRAASVVKFLVMSGAPQAVFSSIGFGELRPVAPNDTAVNKAKNRRIEFDVNG